MFGVSLLFTKLLNRVITAKTTGSDVFNNFRGKKDTGGREGGR